MKFNVLFVLILDGRIFRQSSKEELAVFATVLVLLLALILR